MGILSFMNCIVTCHCIEGSLSHETLTIYPAHFMSHLMTHISQFGNRRSTLLYFFIVDPPESTIPQTKITCLPSFVAFFTVSSVPPVLSSATSAMRTSQSSAILVFLTNPATLLAVSSVLISPFLLFQSG